MTTSDYLAVIVSVAEKSPELFVILIMLVVFFGYMKFSQTSVEKNNSECRAFITEQNKNFLNGLHEITSQVRDNSKQMTDIIIALNNQSDEIARLNAQLERKQTGQLRRSSDL